MKISVLPGHPCARLSPSISHRSLLAIGRPLCLCIASPVQPDTIRKNTGVLTWMRKASRCFNSSRPLLPKSAEIRSGRRRPADSANRHSGTTTLGSPRQSCAEAAASSGRLRTSKARAIPCISKRKYLAAAHLVVVAANSPFVHARYWRPHGRVIC